MFVGTTEQLINALRAMPIRGGISGQHVAVAAADALTAAQEENERLVHDIERLSASLSAEVTENAKLRKAIEALGVMPEGYCFCSRHRIGDDSKIHEPECADIRAALDALPR